MMPTELRSVERNRRGEGEPPRGRRTARRPRRLIAFGLSADEWDRLAELAADEVRDPQDQARWIVLQALRVDPDEVAS